MMNWVDRYEQMMDEIIPGYWALRQLVPFFHWSRFCYEYAFMYQEMGKDVDALWDLVDAGVLKPYEINRAQDQLKKDLDAAMCILVASYRWENGWDEDPEALGQLEPLPPFSCDHDWGAPIAGFGPKKQVFWCPKCGLSGWQYA